MKRACLPVVIVLLLQLFSCSYNIIADYDQQTVDKIIEVYRTINLFYINMAEYDTNDRQYDKFDVEYKRIEVELQTLVLINKLRSNNEESTKQAETILGL